MPKEKVLVIEDNTMNMELVSILLEQVGSSTIQATTAESGITMAKIEHPSLILMDVSLPGMDGLEAVRILKQDASTQHIPIIVMTAHAMRGDETKARRAGCDGYLTKPFNTREFLQLIGDYIKPQEQENKTFSTQKTKNILIVDDEVINRELLEDLLESFGHRSESVTNGIEALARLYETDSLELPDLILLDVMMPGMNGFEVARIIRNNEITADLPIVMVTALSSREDRLRAVEAGANDFIAKPIDVTELRVRITSLLKMKEAQDTLKQHHAELEYTVKQRTSALRYALEEVSTAHHETQEAHLDTIYRLAVASEYKDKDTATHIWRVSNYCSLMGRHLQLSEEEINLLSAASPMHDVGKIGIPDAILLKPGKLTSEEWGIMQEHTTIGARILRGSSSTLLQAGEIIALSHHEKWDGTGYPNRLAGTAIPLWGRICAIADVFDALTNERPYKKAFSNQQAMEIICAERGRHFDPDLVDLFVSIMDEIVGIQSEVSS
jgi:putative two-component system response regulator